MKMRKIAAILICLALLVPAALAEGVETMVVDYGDGSMLITADGTELTQVGDYGFIYRVSDSDCPADRVLYYATSDASVSPDDSAADGEVEAWPSAQGNLEEGSEVLDIPLNQTEQPDEEVSIGDVVESNYDMGDFDGPFETSCALMDSQGNLLTDFAYTMFTHDVKNALVVGYRTDGFVSALDEKGNVLLEGEYAAIVSDTQGGFFATKPDLTMIDEYGDFYYKSALMHVRADGTENDTGIITGTYDLSGFSSGLMCVSTFPDLGTFGEDDTEDDAEDMSYIFVDPDGNDAFGQVFTGAYNFSGNYADVTDADYNERLIDRTGAVVTDKAYSWFDFGAEGDGMPIVANLVDGGFDLLSKDDLSVVKSFAAPETGAAYYAYQSGDHLIFAFSDDDMSILDAAGEVIYEGAASVDAYTYYNYADSQPGRILVSEGDWPEEKCRLMDLSGNATSEDYQEITALTWVGGAGRYQIASYNVVDSGEGKDADYDSYRYGVIDQDGNTILEMKYTEMSYLTPDRYWVSDGSVYQLVDANGNVVFEMSAAQ
jgi:hypothetical protein